MATCLRFFALAVLLQLALSTDQGGLQIAIAQQSIADVTDVVAVLLNGASQAEADARSWASISHGAFCAKRQDRAKCEGAVRTMAPVLLEWFNRRIVVGQQAQNVSEQWQERNTGDCSLCKYVVTYLKTAIQSQATKDAISHATQEACAKLPAEFQETCIDVVVRYEDLLLQYMGTTNAATFCSSVGACKAAALKPALPPSLVKLLDKSQPSIEGGSFCGTCKVLVLEAHQLVEDPETQQEITDFIKNTCQAVVPMFADICTQYVDEYAPAVFALLDEYLDEDLCTTLGFCSAEEMEQLEEDDEDILMLSAVDEEEESNLYEEEEIEQQLREQQENMVPYVASLLVSQDLEAQSRGQESILRGSDKSAITTQIIKSLGLDAKTQSRAVKKLPCAMHMGGAVSRRLLQKQG